MAVETTDWIAHHARTMPEKTAMHDLASGRVFTYADMDDRVGRVAAMLRDKGIQKGDRVAFLMLNSSDLMEVICGCWRIGAVVLALNFRLTLPEWDFILKDSEASAVIFDDVFKDAAHALKASAGISDWIETTGLGKDSPYETALAAADPIFEMTPQIFDDQCMLMYSSGTTGTPKGVIITHGMTYFAPAGGARYGESTPDAVSLNNMPLFHIGAIVTTALPAIWIGGTMAIMRVFDVEQTLDAINDPALGVTTLFMVPAAYNGLRAHPKSQSTDFSRIQIALTGAETVPTELVHYWIERGLYIQEGYGMTETTGSGCLLEKSAIPAKVGSAGKSLIHSQIEIMDPNGKVLPRGEMGEICFKGACVTPGYWRNPDANEEAFHPGGWFRSGDIGRMDEDAYIYIEDRIKDMYISAGENVYPAEIENLLYQMPQIAEAAVVGVPDEKWGEAGCVVCALKPGQSLTLDEITAHVEASLAKYKRPVHLHIVEALPRNATGKVLKFELRKSLPDLLEL